MTPEISIIIPTYKSADILEKNIMLLKSYLDENNLSNEIILVDDGSDDKGATQEAAKSLNIVFLANPVNTGKGAALKLGFEKAQGRFCIFTDADIPYQLDNLMEIYKKLSVENFDVVVGDRNLEGSIYYEKTSFLRNFGSWAVITMVNIFITRNWKDTQCGIKGFKANVGKRLFSMARINRFAIDIEIVFLAIKYGYNIKKINVSLRSNEKSTINIVNDGIKIIFDIFKIRLNELRGAYHIK